MVSARKPGLAAPSRDGAGAAKRPTQTVGVIGATPLVEELFAKLLFLPTLPEPQPLGLSGEPPAPLACLIVVLDRGAGLTAVLDRAAHIAARHACKIICVYDGELADVVLSTRALGVFLHLKASAPRTVLTSAVVLASYISTLHIEDGVQRSPEPSSVPQLTPRQRAVLKLLAQGYSNKAMARALILSEPTIKMHVAALRRAFNATNRTEVLSKALRHGLIPR